MMFYYSRYAQRSAYDLCILLFLFYYYYFYSLTLVEISKKKHHKKKRQKMRQTHCRWIWIKRDGQTKIILSIRNCFLEKSVKISRFICSTCLWLYYTDFRSAFVLLSSVHLAQYQRLCRHRIYAIFPVFWVAFCLTLLLLLAYLNSTSKNTKRKITASVAWLLVFSFCSSVGAWARAHLFVIRLHYLKKKTAHFFPVECNK